MWWYGRGNSGGSWLPEEKKANMWHGRGNSGGSWPPAFPCSPHKIVFVSKYLANLVKTLQFHFKTRFTVRNNNRKTCLPPLVRLMAYSPPTPSLQSKIEGSVNLKYKSTYQGCEMESSHVKGFTPRSWQGYNIRQKFGDRRKDRTSESVYTVSKYLIID